MGSLFAPRRHRDRTQSGREKATTTVEALTMKSTSILIPLPHRFHFLIHSRLLLRLAAQVTAWRSIIPASQEKEEEDEDEDDEEEEDEEEIIRKT